MLPYNKKLVSNAQALRKHMTAEEKHIYYDLLIKLPFTVKRQKNIENFIVDFYIPEKKTVIEIDGVQHTEHEHESADALRDARLSQLGITVIRYYNRDINSKFSAVAEDLLEKLGLGWSDLKET